ncbi:hypothetical protein BBF96_14280 [Anoxybacter fermentans]|uniref:PhoU domain-containing protein n=1 Tax=Anoxybacter fermentans TaxID=1323375 RepID=A0A3Q9HS93_9FIRM|nr:Na/Pi cotransporter family protein [Anoxybacter fermentans]AZR74452.1 hypothetical protein BBF96_14280 [Anoxybacter fermentans]
MLIFFGIVGGLAIFLYGMQIASESLQLVAGSRFKKVLKFLTKNQFMGVAFGCIVTFLLQSSSATTVLLVSFVSASLMNLTQTLGVILGANIGTTLTVQLISLKFSDYALLLIALGFLLRFMKKNPHFKEIGGVILGFGFIFYGMKIMSDSMVPLRTVPTFTHMLTSLGQRPVLGTILATLFTAIIQSSAATLGLAISLSTQGLLPLKAAIPIIFGSNIGTCATALLSSIGVSQEAKKVAIAHTLFKIMGVIIFFPFIGQLTALMQYMGGDMGRQIANIHTIFNVGLAVIFIPFTSQMAKLVHWLVPEKKEEGIGVPRYITPKALDTPMIAIEQANQEVIRIGRLIQKMTKEVLDAVLSKNRIKLAELQGLEAAIDRLAQALTNYLSDLSQKTIDEHTAQKVINLLFINNDLEHIGDLYEKMLTKGYKILKDDLNFSNEGLEELREMHKTVIEMIDLTIDALEYGDWEKARTVTLEQPYIIMDEWRYRKTHILRLQQGIQDSRATSNIHLDLINIMQKVCEHSRNICQVLLYEAGQLYDLFNIFEDAETVESKDA